MYSTTAQILKALTNRPSRMVRATSYAKRLRMHVFGDGYLNYLEQINYYENSEQYRARKDHAISNKAEVANLLLPVEKLWSAKGGSSNMLMTDTDRNAKLLKIISSRGNGISLQSYVQNTYFKGLITDPNGITLFEYDQDIIHPVYVPIEEIHDYELDGITIKWLLLTETLTEERINTLIPLTDGETIEQVNVKKVTYIDSKNQFTAFYVNGKLRDSKWVKNKMKRVPAIVNSPLYDEKRDIRTSPLDCQVELLDRLLISNSVLNINEFFYNFIRGWEYAPECSTCNGDGMVPDVRDPSQMVTCPDCHGTRLKSTDPTDVFLMRPPKSSEDPIITQPFGYIYPPTDAWEYQTTSIKDKRNFMFYTHWGTTYEQGVQSNTATGRFIDADSVDTRLSAYATIIEGAHNQMLQILSMWAFRDTDGLNYYKYGRRFMIEAPDTIWDKYLEAKSKNAPMGTLDLLLSNYIESEYKDNQRQLIIYLKLMRVEPFLHNTVEQVLTFPIDDTVKLQKIYFSEWLSQMEDDTLLGSPTTALKESLIEYCNNQKFVKPKEEKDGTQE